MLSLVTFLPSGKRDYYLANMSDHRTGRVAIIIEDAQTGGVDMNWPLFAVKSPHRIAKRCTRLNALRVSFALDNADMHFQCPAFF